MNNGAFGENFPYSNFHDLNMDWIIKIAKDFLDQYTHIQELIRNGETSLTNLTTEGLQQLGEKADELEALLQRWYDTHSADIANELTTALETLHTTLLNTLSQFTAQASAIAEETIRTIPSDYTELYNRVLTLEDLFTYGLPNILSTSIVTEGRFVAPNGVTNSNPNWGTIQISNLTPGDKFSIVGGRHMTAYFGTGGVVSGGTDSTEDEVITIPANANTVVISFLLANRNTMAVVQSNTIVPFENTLNNPSNELNVYNKNEVDQKINSAFKAYPVVIHPATYASNLPDADNAIPNSIYRMTGFQSGTSNIPQHLPFTKWNGTESQCAFLIDLDDPSTHLYRTQVFLTNGSLYCRRYYLTQSAWYPWVLMNDTGCTLVVDKDHPSIADYTSLSKAIYDNSEKHNVTIIVNPGTYDMIDELEEILGEGYLETISSRWFGYLYLSNNIKIICADNAKITCNYTGTNHFINDYFSPFNAGTGDFTLENMNIVCHNVRYCIHDEKSTDTEVYTHKYIRCKMYKNSNNSADQEQCIGGGLGTNGQIIIQDCYFDGDMTTPQMLVSYHNSISPNAQSTVIVNGCYFDKQGKLRLSYHGTTLLKTLCMVSNNSFGSAIELTQETPEYNTQNIRLVEWNNIIR